MLRRKLAKFRIYVSEMSSIPYDTYDNILIIFMIPCIAIVYNFCGSRGGDSMNMSQEMYTDHGSLQSQLLHGSLASQYHPDLTTI